MSTSAIDKRRSFTRMQKAAVIHLSVSVFLVVFNLVYSSMSYGQTSIFMQLMFLFPLVMGFIPFLILALTKKEAIVSRASFNLWNAACAVFVAGCLVRGIINISGRFTRYDTVYWIAGGVVVCLSVIFNLIALRARAKKPQD